MKTNCWSGYREADAAGEQEGADISGDGSGEKDLRRGSRARAQPIRGNPAKPSESAQDEER